MSYRATAYDWPRVMAQFDSRRQNKFAAFIRLSLARDPCALEQTFL
jgi:hypothetical protein